MPELVKVEEDGAVAIVTLDHPPVNALSAQLVEELEAEYDRLDRSDEIRALIFRGAGEKAFSAGADIHEMAASSPDELAERQQRRAAYTWHLATLAKPTIGAINGLAYGGAAVLSSSLDIRIGCERSSFRFLAASYGRINSTWTLPYVVGWPRAKELLYTARVVTAEARQMATNASDVKMYFLLRGFIEFSP